MTLFARRNFFEVQVNCKLKTCFLRDLTDGQWPIDFSFHKHGNPNTVCRSSSAVSMDRIDTLLYSPCTVVATADKAVAATAAADTRARGLSSSTLLSMSSGRRLVGLGGTRR